MYVEIFEPLLLKTKKTEIRLFVKPATKCQKASYRALVASPPAARWDHLTGGTVRCCELPLCTALAHAGALIKLNNESLWVLKKDDSKDE